MIYFFDGDDEKTGGGEGESTDAPATPATPATEGEETKTEDTKTE